MSETETSRAGSPGLFWALGALVVLVLAGCSFVLLGNPRYMPPAIQRLAMKMGNPNIRMAPPDGWSVLCGEWNTWVPALQREGPRWLKTEGLLTPDDPLRPMLEEFLAHAAELRPESIVPEAVEEKSLYVLGRTPPPAVMEALQLSAPMERVHAADRFLLGLRVQLETWQGWKRMHALLALTQRRDFTRVAAALRPRLPPLSETPGYRADARRTIAMLNAVSRDEDGLGRLLGNWSEFSRFAAVMRTSPDPGLQAMPDRLIEGLADQPALAEFAGSLEAPLREMRKSGVVLPEPTPAAVPTIFPVPKGAPPSPSIRLLVPVR
ncbi:MAG TPA: hypothetical protein VG734_03040 [Lacunisphaera sp.]|nr:hypothetical protein [Lacunisphaera sp.]